MMKVLAYFKQHPVLAAAIAASIITSFFVPPDAGWLDYFDWKTLACLFSILGLVEALRNAGVFQRLAFTLVGRLGTCRPTICALVGITLVISMFATNDMALVMMLPLSAIMLISAGWGKHLAFTFVMQNLAANLGGMIMPFGNPQNLYLFERFHISLGDFLGTMALPFVVSVVLIAACCVVHLRGEGKTRAQVQAKRIDGSRPKRDPNVVYDATDAPATGGPTGPTYPVRVGGYCGMLALVLLSVFRVIPFWIPLVLVIIMLAVWDRAALRATDIGLLCTFVCFFIFAGNMSRIPAVQDILSGLMTQAPLLVSAGFSQIISNVPAAVLLAQFTTDWAPLLIGVNIGGAGTIIASLASLITFAQYRKALASNPDDVHLKGQNAGTFMLQFTIYNVGFLVVLLAICGGATYLF